MPTKPTVDPEWATTDVVDPTSGQNNVAEPSAPKKATGWDREEIPPRQWLNWWQRIVYLWIEWFKGSTLPLSLGPATTNDVPTDGTGHTHEVAGFLATDENLSEIAAAGDVAKAAARDNLGIQVYQENLSIAADGDLTGTITAVRIGRLVTLYSGGLSHASASQPSTLAGCLPAEFRPTSDDAYNSYFLTETITRGVRVVTTGAIIFVNIDTSTGSLTNSVTTGPWSISYVIE